MNDFEHVRIATDKVGHHWFNFDPFRFAVQPDESDAHQHAMAERVEHHVRTFRDADSHTVRRRILLMLLDMHAVGDILWPLGTPWGTSCLGPLGRDGFRSALAEFEPSFGAIWEFLNNEPTMRYAGKQRLTMRQHTGNAFMVLGAIKLASGNDPKRLVEFESDDFTAFVEVARRDGVWAAWLPMMGRMGLFDICDYFGKQRQDPSFGTLKLLANSYARSAGHGKGDVFGRARHLRWVEQSFDQYLNERNTMTRLKEKAGQRLLGEFFATLPREECDEPEVAFGRKTMLQLLVFAKNWRSSGTRAKAVASVRDYLTWYIDNVRDERGFSIPEPLFKGDYDRFFQQVDATAPAKVIGEVRARPMPARYHAKLKEIITEDDFAWPKSLTVRGKPRYWRMFKNPETGKYEQVFCPVLPRLLLLMLDVPLRGIQARRLDSGEGDAMRWVPSTRRWEVASGPHSGHWDRQGALNSRRGVFRELQADKAAKITGLWINSNKSNDRAALFDETSGYEIPWEYPEVLENLAAMREWQEKYNPVSGPLAHKDLPPGIFPNDDPGEAIRERLPARFYLFRFPFNAGDRGREAPPNDPQLLAFFHEALGELERRLNAEDPDTPVRIILERTGKTGTPTKAVFSIHGMRSSTLTTLHLAGVPIEILSKAVAGHSSILMTLQYLKFDPLHVSRVLTEGRLKAVTEDRAAFPEGLGATSFDLAARMTARLSDDGLRQMYGPSYSDQSMWARMDIGLCPNGCTLCHIGGEAIVNASEKQAQRSIHGRTPGIRACVRCRFFVTGLPFLIPLWTHAMAVMAQADAHARRAAEQEEAVRALKAERREAAKDGGLIDPGLRDRIRIGEGVADNAREQRDQALAELHSVMALIEQVRAISAEGTDGTLPMLSPAGEVPSVVGRDSTRFEVADAVVQASRFFPSLRSDELERERDAFLDRVLYSNGYVPITLAPLSQEERRRAADAMSALLLIELGAVEAQKLIEGSTSIADLGIEGRLQETCRKAIGRPLEALALPPQASPVFEVVAAE